MCPMVLSDDADARISIWRAIQSSKGLRVERDDLRIVELSPVYTRVDGFDPKRLYTRPPTVLIDTIAQTNIIQMPEIRTLKIRYELSPEDVKKLTVLFPGVVNVALFLDDESFRLICGEWSQLEELEVLGNKLTSEGITGIKDTKIGATLSWLTAWSTPKPERNPRNITCLKDLRRFIMTNSRYEDDHNPTLIDDNCVDQGFLMMPRLNYLRICSNKITMDGWTKLFKWDQLLTLEPSDGGSYTLQETSQEIVQIF